MWIQECISSANPSILTNATPKGFFAAQKGLRQGDPLSPFLFAIVREDLSHMISVAREENLISGFKSAASTPTVTHNSQMTHSYLAMLKKIK